MSWSYDPVMWSTQIISPVIWSCDLNIIFNQTPTKFQYTYFIDLTKLCFNSMISKPIYGLLLVGTIAVAS